MGCVTCKVMLASDQLLEASTRPIFIEEVMLSTMPETLGMMHSTHNVVCSNLRSEVNSCHSASV